MDPKILGPKNICQKIRTKKLSSLKILSQKKSIGHTKEIFGTKDLGRKKNLSKKMFGPSHF